MRLIVLLLVVYRFCDTTGQQLCQLREPTKNLVCRAYHADPKNRYSKARHLSDELLALSIRSCRHAGQPMGRQRYRCSRARLARLF